MSGKELAVILEHEYPQLKILFISGYTDAVISHQGAIDSNIAFLPKPFTITTLGTKVGEMLTAR